MAKKGGGGKRGKSAGKAETKVLTDAERRALQEQAIIDFKKKCQEEDRLSRLNDLKIKDQWRNVMRSQKAVEIKKGIEILNAVHQRQLDRKNALLKSLDKDVIESEEQYQNAVRSHLINIENFNEMQTDRIAALEKGFYQQVEEMQREFKKEKDCLVEKHKKEKSDLLGIMGRMGKQYGDTDTDFKHEFATIKEDIRNKNLEEKHALRIQLEGMIEELSRQFQSAWTSYNTSTEERKQQFELLKKKDQSSAKTIEQQMRKLQKLQDSIVLLRSKLSGTSKDFDEKTRTLREEKDAIQKQFQFLKRKMNQYRETERKKLIQLARLAHQVYKNLKEKVEQAEKIVELAEMNRKLETNEELVRKANQRFALRSEEESSSSKTGGVVALPSLVDSAGSAAAVVSSSSMEEKSAAAIVVAGRLERFYAINNKVLLDKMHLESEKKELLDENASLRALLKQYLDGISVNDHVLREKNSLFIVNGNINLSMKLLRPPDFFEHGPKNITSIDANRAFIQGKY